MKLGIVGSGGIVHEVLEALQPVENVTITAICVRPQSRERAEALAKEYHIARVFTDYDDFLCSPDIDFVYIGIINSQHFAYTWLALNANKNVIVEKPFASNLKEVKTLINQAKLRDLFLFEAVSLLHMPNFAKMQELLVAIGKITMVQANYSQYSSRYDRYLDGDVQPAFDLACSGGALYDINIYNLNLIIGLLGKPKSASYMPNIGFNGIDTSGVALLQYKDFPAVSVGAKDSSSPSGCIIQGEKGYLRTIGTPNELQSFEVGLNKKVPQTFAFNTYKHRLSHEFDAFAQYFAAKDFAARDKYLDISLQVAEIAEKARLSANIHFPADKN